VKAHVTSSTPPSGLPDRDPSRRTDAGSPAFEGVVLRLDPSGTVTRSWGTGPPGLLLADPLGRRYDAVIPVEVLQAAYLPTRIGEALASGLPVQIPCVEVGRPPAARFLRIRVVPDRSSEVEILLEDVTDAVEAAVRAEREAWRARTAVLASHVAHDLRNPLSALSLTIQVVAASGAVDPRHRAVLEKVQAQVARLDRIVEDLVAFSRPHVVARRAVDLAAIARDVAGSTAPDAPVLVEGPATALADPSLLRQALACLLVNAREVASERVEVHVGPGPRLQVSDDGPPMAAEERAGPFDPFTRSRGGSTLALALAQRLVEAMGGALDLAPGAGTTLRISLPAPGEPSPSPGGSAAHTG
jgi:signal transduction histidine kinase